jgi:membrane-associated phospholipid phosphatase
VAVHRTEGESGRRYVVVAGLVAVLWSAVLLLMLSLGWLVTDVLGDSLDPVDNGLSEWLADQRTGTLSDLAEIGGTGGDTITICAIALVVAIGASVWARSVRPLIFLAVGLVGQALVYDLTSRLITRDRPPVQLLDHGLDPNASYPSGHVSTAVMFFGGVVALVWVYAAPRWRAPAMLLLVVPLVVGAARLYQGAHHLTDALASLVVMPFWVLALTVLILRPQLETADQSRSLTPTR